MRPTSKIANCIDLELHEDEIIEVGLTTIDLSRRQIIKSYSFPIKHDKRISDEIYQLTGWTQSKLNKGGEELPVVYKRLLEKYGLLGRLLITDDKDEFKTLNRDTDRKNTYQIGCHYFPHIPELDRGILLQAPEQMNVSNLFRIKYKDFSSQSLEGMLKATGLGFVGRQHRAKDDSYNIARLFLHLIDAPVIQPNIGEITALVKEDIAKAMRQALMDSFQ